MRDEDHLDIVELVSGMSEVLGLTGFCGEDYLDVGGMDVYWTLWSRLVGYLRDGDLLDFVEQVSWMSEGWRPTGLFRAG